MISKKDVCNISKALVVSVVFLFMLPSSSADSSISSSENPVFIPEHQGTENVMVSWSSDSDESNVWMESSDGSRSIIGAGSSGSVSVEMEPVRVYRFFVEDPDGEVSELVVGTISDDGPSLGANKFDLFLHYFGGINWRAGSERQHVSKEMAKKSIKDAKDVGIGYFRVSVTGWAPTEWGQPGDLDGWVNDPDNFWSLMDEMMDDLDESDVKIVPVFVWNYQSFPSMVGNETTRDLVVDRNSKSYEMLLKYTEEWIDRYKERDTVLFYEMTNEMNIVVDLDMEKITGMNSHGNIRADEMIDFLSDYADEIRSLDPHRLVSSGFALQRPSAQHMREFSGLDVGGPDWTNDTEEEFVRYLEDTHHNIDIVSVHLYNGGSHEMFGYSDADILRFVNNVTLNMGKILFVGEYGDIEGHSGPGITFSGRVMDVIADEKIPFSAFWTWHDYRGTTHLPNELNVEYVLNYELGEHIKKTNEIMNGHEIEQSESDTMQPAVIVTYPYQGLLMQPEQLLFAVASDDRGPIEKVEFYLEDDLIAILNDYPYQYNLSTSDLEEGYYDIKAVAFDKSSNSASWTTKVVVGNPSDESGYGILFIGLGISVILILSFIVARKIRK